MRNNERGTLTTTSAAIVVTSNTIVVIAGTLTLPIDNINDRVPSHNKSTAEATPIIGVKNRRMYCTSKTEEKRLASGNRNVKKRMNVSTPRAPNRVRVVTNVATNLLRFLRPAARPKIAMAEFQNPSPITNTIVPYCSRMIFDDNKYGPKIEITMAPISMCNLIRNWKTIDFRKSFAMSESSLKDSQVHLLIS